MQPRFMPHLEDPADSLVAAGVETDANIALAWSDAGTVLIDTAPETSPDLSLSNQDTALADVQHHLDDDIATPAPDASAADSVSHNIQDATAPEDGGPVPVAIFSAPVTSVPALAVSANPVAESAGPQVADVSIGDGGAFVVPPHADYPIFHAGPTATAPLHGGGFATAAIGADPATSAPAQLAQANLANPAHQTSGAIAAAGVGTNGATAVQVQQALDESGLNVNGTGIRVGVLSDSFNDLGGAAADEADGALPSASHIQVLEDLGSGGTDEGRAMMQVIHDIAPAASLAFYTAFESEQDFANGILALAAAGCKVICDDVSYFDEPFFQNGVVAQAIETVEAEGVTYVTSAGNNASNGYQAAWTPISGTFDGWSLTNAESFGGSVVQTVTINTEGTNDTVPLILQWNQPYGATTSDLEVVVFHNGILYGEFSNRNAGQELNNPLVEVQLPSGTYQIAIENLSGPNPGLIKEITSGDGFPATISGANTGTVVGHAMTPGAITAGAVSAADTPAFGFNPASESFSSSGAGAELLFADNGTAWSSPDVRDPVAVSGIDDIATTVAGSLGDFYGTSAASASLAGVAALMLSANPALTPVQVEQIMEETALPMSGSAVSGAGLVRVDAAVAAAEALIRVTIESFGSTSLHQIGENYDLDSISSGTGPELQRGGVVVTAGEYAGWKPIGAEQVAGGGYDVAWENASTGQFTVWSANSNGNYLSNLIPDVAGNSIALELLENTFHQDLNGEGTIGLVGSAIEAHGSTSLLQVGRDFDLENISTGTGSELQRGGAPVTVGEYAGWTLIGAEQVAGGGYDLALKNASTGQYSVWSINSNGNYLSNLVTQVAGNSTALETLETTFHQDLNGDGTTGIVSKAIESSDSTSLVEVGNTYDLDSISTGTGPELQRGGAPVTVGEYAGWTLIGAEQVAGGGYDVAWENTSTGQFTVWRTNSNGNYLSNLIPDVAGNSIALELLENTFHQDLNGDGTIGLVGTVIDSSGSTSLLQVGHDFDLENISSGTGPELKRGGAPITVGEYAGWTLIGTEQVAGGGYDVAWENTSTGQFTVWSTNSNGNYLSNLIPDVKGNSTALETLETTFHQDLNGDGVIGTSATIATGGTLELAAPDSVSVQFGGPTGSLILDKSSAFAGQITGFSGNGSMSGSDQIDLRDIGFGPGTTVAYTGTSSGGKLTVTDAQHHTANIELAGNHTGSTFSLSSDGSGGTIVIDPPVKQDLAGGTLSFNDPGPTDKETVTVSLQNGGAGYVGNFTVDAVTTANGQDSAAWHFNFDSSPVATTVTQSYEVTAADHHTDGTNSTTTQSVTVTIACAGSDVFVFHSGVGADTIVNATSADTIELDGFSSVTSNHQLASLLAEAQAGLSQPLFQTANGGHDTVIHLGNHDVITLANVPLSALHASDFIVH